MCNLKAIFSILKAWFDFPTPQYEDFDSWRRQTYQDLRYGRINNLPLKTWWPQYSSGDFRLELCVGALLVQQIAWSQVQSCIENLQGYLESTSTNFDLDGLLGIPPEKFERLIKPSRFPKSKTEKVLKFCQFLKDYGSIDTVFRLPSLGKKLPGLKCGFGPETRDCVLLYAANQPVFIADAYTRKLLEILNGKKYSYDTCQRFLIEGMAKDFSSRDLEEVVNGYTPEELRYALVNSPRQDDVPLLLLYQQFHAGIVELGISKRWELFKAKCQ